ncbi:MAG: hypothetical protein JWN18_571 [Parcubacteria group bacterium]|nr:hypothetical protein [Parcubacteria group bacterium]
MIFEVLHGVVVCTRDKRWLNKNATWKHIDAKGVAPSMRAWVHPVTNILAGGLWEGEAYKVARAYYHPERGWTIVHEQPELYGEFVSRMKEECVQ